MFTLATNLAIWMAAVVDESVHQAHAYSGSYGNTSHARLTPDCKFPVSTGPVAARHWMGALRIHSQSTMPLPGHGGKRQRPGASSHSRRSLGSVGRGDKEQEYTVSPHP